MRTTFARLRQAGFTLIEIIIALLIGVIGIVIMMQTFAVSEGFKRTATSGTDAQINGAVALYMLEREIRLAGYGMNALMSMGCTSVRVWNEPPGSGIDLRLVPFEINPAGVPAGDPSTDTLLITYGTSDSFVAGVLADQPTNVATGDFLLYSNRDGFKNGDLFVSVQPGGGPGGTASCVMHEATKAPPAAGNCGTPPPAPTSLVHGTGVFMSWDTACQNKTASHNAAGGIRDSGGVLVPVVKMASGGQLFNLGVPSIRVYAIRGGNLTFCDWVASDCTQAANYAVQVNDVVSMRAVYGMNLTPVVNQLPGDGVVTWGRAPLTGNVYLPSRVMAVALEITARSSLKEKYNQAGACDATAIKSRPDRTQDWLYQSMAGAEIDLLAPGLADWDCYRYKLFQTRVPLRNMIWRP